MGGRHQVRYRVINSRYPGACLRCERRPRLLARTIHSTTVRC